MVEIYLNPDNDAAWEEKENADTPESREAVATARSLLSQVRAAGEGGGSDRPSGWVALPALLTHLALSLPDFRLRLQAFRPPLPWTLRTTLHPPAGACTGHAEQELPSLPPPSIAGGAQGMDSQRTPPPPPPPQVRAQDMQSQRYKVLECYALMAGKIQVGEGRGGRI